MAEKAVAHKMIGGGHQIAIGKSERTPTRRSIESLGIKKAKNGGHVVTHHYASPTGHYTPSEDHVFGPGEGEQVMAHVRKHGGFNKMAAAAKMNAAKAEGSAAEEAGESPDAEAAEGE